MSFPDLLEIVGEEPVFETGLLLAGSVDPTSVRRQLSRWTRAGRLYQLRRGLYALAPPFAKVRPHPFVVANRLVPGSYVSLQSALAEHGLIPEHVPAVTSVSADRPGGWNGPLGRFEFRHVKPEMLFGYTLRRLGARQKAFVASPEKALLDLVYLEPRGDSEVFLQGLRLQGLDSVDPAALEHLAERSGAPKLRRAARRIAALAEEEAEAYVRL